MLEALFVFLILLCLWGLFTYNHLIRLNNMVKEGWSGIETQLKRRSDLIPNLLATVKGYMAHETATFEKITQLRTQCLSTQQKGDRALQESALGNSLSTLFAVSEQYPELKANTTFIELQQALQETEDQIQLARRYYNGATRDLNIAIESFPSNLIANYFKFRKYDYFEVESPEERTVKKVQF